MKILSSPDISSWKHICKCYGCESELEVNSEDLYKNPDEYEGDYNSSRTYYIGCPICNSRIFIEDYNIPLFIRNKAKMNPTVGDYYNK